MPCNKGKKTVMVTLELYMTGLSSEVRNGMVRIQLKAFKLVLVDIKKKSITKFSTVERTAC